MESGRISAGVEKSKVMRPYLIIVCLLLCTVICAHSQDFYLSPEYYPAQEEISLSQPYLTPLSEPPPQPQSWWQKHRKGFAITGVHLASIVLDATGDAVYDMGKESHNNKQMAWGHTLQATAVGVGMLCIPLIDWKHPVHDGVFMSLSYVAMRYALFDLTYNLTRGIDPLYADGWKAKMPPSEIILTQTFFMGVSLTFNFLELR